MSNRLLQADFRDYLDTLKKYFAFLESTPIIHEYLLDCGECEQDIAKEVKTVQQGYGRSVFSVGVTEKEEVRNVYAFLKYFSENDIDVSFSVADGYSSSNKFQDKVKGFNQRFVMILIRHIENFLTNVGIDMGLDDKISYNVTVQNGQAIFAGDNATITATNTVGIDKDELAKLIAAVRDNANGLSPEESETVNTCLDTMADEAKSEKPKRGVLMMAKNALSVIKGTAEFGAAVAALIQFITPLL